MNTRHDGRDCGNVDVQRFSKVVAFVFDEMGKHCCFGFRFLSNRFTHLGFLFIPVITAAKSTMFCLTFYTMPEICIVIMFFL